jgi:hypothetical protein
MSSMPPLTRISVPATGPAVAESYRQKAAALVEGGCDLILTEMMIDVENAALVLGRRPRDRPAAMDRLQRERQRRRRGDPLRGRGD